MIDVERSLPRHALDELATRLDVKIDARLDAGAAPSSLGRFDRKLAHLMLCSRRMTTLTPPPLLPTRREYAWLALPCAAALFFCAAPALASAVDRWDVDGEVRFLHAAEAQVDPLWEGFLRELSGTPAGTRYHDDMKLAVELVIAVDPSGRIVRTETAGRSGVEGFDQAPVDLVHDLASLPPPPASLRSDDGLVYVRWRFARDPTGCDERGVVMRQLPLEDAILRLVADGRSDVAVERVRDLEGVDPARARAALSLLARTMARRASNDLDPQLRTAAAAALAYDEESTPILTALAKNDRDDRVRRTALLSLGEHAATRESLQILEASLATEEAGAAVRALGRLGDRRALPGLRRMLAEGRLAVEVTRALRALGDGQEATQIVARMLESNTHRRDAGLQAARELAAPSLAPALIAVVNDGSEGQRGRAVAALGVLGQGASSEVRHAVVLATSDASSSVREVAAEALGTWGDHSLALRYRLMDLLNDPEPRVRAESVASLVAVGGEAVRDELTRPLRDGDAAVRAALGRALVTHPFDGSLVMANRLAADVDEDVRLAVFRAIPSDAAPDLRRLRARAATDPSGKVRAAVLPASPAAGAPADPTAAAAWLLRADDAADRLSAAAAWLGAGRRAPVAVEAAAAAITTSSAAFFGPSAREAHVAATP